MLVVTNWFDRSNLVSKTYPLLPPAISTISTANEELYRHAFSNLGVPLLLCSVPELRIIIPNHCSVETFGYTREELKQLTLPDLCADNNIKYLQQTLIDGGVIDQSYLPKVVRLRKRDGTLTHISPKISFYTSEGLTYVCLAAVDIATMINVQNELSLANSRLQAAQKIAVLGYWSNDLKTGKIIWSDELNQIFELDQQTFEVSLPNIMAMFEEEDRAIFMESIDDLFRYKNSIELEQRIVTPAGKKKWIFQRLKVLTDENGHPLFLEGITQDITPRKNTELQLLKRNKMLLCISQFTAAILHSGDWHAATTLLFKSIQDILKVDSVCYFENDEREDIEEKCAECKVKWSNEHTFAQNIERIPLRYIEDAIKVMKAGQRFVADSFSPGDSAIKDTLRNMGVRSALMLPTITAGKFYGFMCLHDHANERVWDKEELDFLDMVVANLNVVFEKTRYQNDASASALQLESIISNMPGIVMRKKYADPFTVNFISNEVEKITGYPAKDFINSAARTWESIIHPDDIALKTAAMKNVLPGQNYDLTYRIVCRNGETRWLSSRAKSVTASDGEMFIDSVLTDISESIQQTNALAESNSKFSLLMRSSSEAIIDWNITSEHVVWGDGLQRFFGYDPATFTRKLWKENVHEHDVKKVLATIQQAQNDPASEMITVDYRFFKTNGEMAYVHHRCMFLRNSEGTAYRGLIEMIDITAAMKQTETIREQNEALKKIAWTQSHVVRAPIANILGAVNILEQTEGMPHELKEFVVGLKGITEKLDAVVTSIVEESNSILNPDI